MNQTKIVDQEKERVEEKAGHEVQLGQIGGLEATGHGAAGKLSGADVSAWQGRC